ncbi:MAG: hypothetical protein HW380_2162 [Magnetococcales bacterium]|nr:hypothetical protein [Magnetococcales bacterium]
MVLSFLFACHWLHREVHPRYFSQVAEVMDRPGHAKWSSLLLMICTNPLDDASFIGHILDRLVETNAGKAENREKIIGDLVHKWRGLGLYATTRPLAVRQIGAVEKAVMQDLGGPNDRERISRVDLLDDGDPSEPFFDKMALIPRMACPQSCRHCMFVWRPPMNNMPDAGPLLKSINRQTSNLLFTGGDLTKDLNLFYHAIATMDRVETFAILLNGLWACSQTAADHLFANLRRSLNRRPSFFSKADVLVQISFDEFHQEIIANRSGDLNERIPVAHIARILIAGAGQPHCQVALIHKQNSLNFSIQLFQKGVFGRLLAELEQQGWKMEDIHWQTSPRLKEHPSQPGVQGGVIREAKILLRGPSVTTTVYFVSSCVDSLGRAELLDPSEYVCENLLFEDWVHGRSPPMDPFDTDPMLWRNGNVTLFGAIHVWMGNYFVEGERVFSRWRKDPLRVALGRLDRRLLVAHQAWNPQQHQRLMQTATSPHSFLHGMTRNSGARLFITQWLLENRDDPSSSP